MLSFMFGVQDREGLSDGMSLPRMIGPLLEGFDPARSPLLFLSGILASCAVRDGSAQLSKSSNGNSDLRTLSLMEEGSCFTWGDCSGTRRGVS
jgi:hypothetical protein